MHYATEQAPRGGEGAEGAQPGAGRSVPSIDYGAAVLQNLLLVIVLAVLGAAAGFAYGAAKDPVFTAEAQVNVGRTDVSSQALPGFVEGVKSLAGTYARAVRSPLITTDVARRLRLPATSVAGHLGASPIPETGTIRVVAKGESARQSARLADAGANSLVAYIGRINSGGDRQRSLLREYRSASASESRLRQRISRIRQQNNGRDTQTSLDLELQRRGSGLRASALGASYREAVQAAVPNFAQVLTPAFAAKSNRASIVQRWSFIGGAVGLLLGVVLAAVRTRRRVLRAYLT